MPSQVDVRFVERLSHPPTLALIRHLVSLPSMPNEVEYIGAEGFQAVNGMALVNRGRLSEFSHSTTSGRE
jgi:hypothetical protein